MAKNSDDGCFSIVAVIFIVIAWAIWDFITNTIGWRNFLILTAIVFIGGFSLRHLYKENNRKRHEEEMKRLAEERYQLLLNKYNNTNIVKSIMDKEIWLGQTLEQLNDSLSYPEDKEEKVLKTKTKETWKYDHKSGKSYGTRVFIENGEVVGWEFK